MAKNTKKQQKRLAKKTAKRKAKKRTIKPIATSNNMLLNQVANWPLLECLITKNWDSFGGIIQIAVVRKSPQGLVAVGTFLVDLACLGVKNALARGFDSESHYFRDYREYFTASQPITACNLDLAAKIIYEAINYAKNLGFKAHRDTKKALKILGPANPENCSVVIPLGGEDGKPFFIAGPYDNPTRIMKILDRTVGQGNYNYMFPIENPDFDDDFD